MHTTKRFPLLTFLTLLAASPVAFSQADKNDAQEAPTGASASSGQEVEVNEDIYRQFMELKDARQQRMILPEDAFKPGSGSQKLDELPEESQKHLRNQLREIIVQGDQWQPGDENADYPYVPSEAAVGNRQLQTKEAEAWEELVDSYHKREAQIYQNSARTKAAMAAQEGQAGAMGTGSGQQSKPGANPGAQGQAGELSEKQRQSQQAGEDVQELPNSARITSSSSNAGVSQNAMEFLQRMQGGSSGEADTGDGQETKQALANSDAEPGPGGPESEPNDVTESSETTSTAPTSRPSANESLADNGSDNPDAENTSGVAQNALEFLQQSGQEGNKDADQGSDTSVDAGDDGGQLAESGQTAEVEQDKDGADETDGDSAAFANEDGSGDTPGTTQNALEYVISERSAETMGQRPDPNAGSTTSGTLSINDLVNARGVGSGRNAEPPPPVPKEQKPGDEIPPDKDGGGR